MPDDRPMPLTGEEEIEPHPILGMPITNYPSDRLRPLVQGWSLLIGLSIIINLALWNVQGRWVGPITVGVVGVLAWGIGWRIIHLWNREVILFEHGFTYIEGSEAIPFQYIEVEAIRLRAETLSYFGGRFKRNVYTITLRTQAGDRLQLTNVYKNVADLGTKIQTAVFTRLQPHIDERLAAGEAVPFADMLRVSQAGLTVDSAYVEGGGDAHLPWSGFGGYRAANRQLVLLDADGEAWFAVPLTDIDNLRLLLRLLKQQTQGETA